MKPLNLSDRERQQIIEKFQEDLMKNTRTLSGKLSWSYDIDKECLKDINKPTVFFSLEAKAKMKMLVEQSAIEIGWHGIVDRLNKDTYVIKDILVYPQTTSATTVCVDEDKYAMWTMTLEDDVFHKMRMQGHSHVNMAVFPSGTDQHLYDQYLNILKENDFYIFMIVNKRNEMFINIHDLSQNVLFEKDDIILKTALNDGTTLEGWYLATTAEYIKKPEPITETRFGETYQRASTIETYHNAATYHNPASINYKNIEETDDNERLLALIERSKTGVRGQTYTSERGRRL